MSTPNDAESNGDRTLRVAAELLTSSAPAGHRAGQHPSEHRFGRGMLFPRPRLVFGYDPQNPPDELYDEGETAPADRPPQRICPRCANAGVIRQGEQWIRCPECQGGER